MPFCPECGTLNEGTNFCPNCGTPQAADTAASRQRQQHQTEVHQPQMEVEEERTIWEGVSWTAAALFTEGKRAAAHYRLTNKALYFSEGLVSTTSQQVPLWAVRDIDVHQGLLQKSRGIGNVDVHVEHSDYTGREKVELKEIQDPEAVRDKLNEHAHRERLNYDQRQRTRYHSRGS